MNILTVASERKGNEEAIGAIVYSFKEASEEFGKNLTINRNDETILSISIKKDDYDPDKEIGCIERTFTAFKRLSPFDLDIVNRKLKSIGLKIVSYGFRNENRTLDVEFQKI